MSKVKVRVLTKKEHAKLRPELYPPVKCKNCGECKEGDVVVNAKDCKGTKKIAAPKTLKLTVRQMSDAFRVIEELNMNVIAVIARQPLECKDPCNCYDKAVLFWKTFPPVMVQKIDQWRDIAVILIGQAKHGLIGLEFTYQKGKGLVCTISKKRMDALRDKVTIAYEKRTLMV